MNILLEISKTWLIVSDLIVKVEMIETDIRVCGLISLYIPDREVFCLPRQVNKTDQLWLHMVDVKHCSGQDMPQGREQSRKVQ